jgi:hypothetical protein
VKNRTTQIPGQLSLSIPRRPVTWRLATTPGPDGRTPLDLFAASVRLSGDFGCWIWTPEPGGHGAWLGNGYGHLWTGMENHTAYRFSYVIHRGEVPDGLALDHLCRVRACVNPWHLEPVPTGVNTLRARGFGRPRRRLRAVA